jgi:hypothetical protein
MWPEPPPRSFRNEPVAEFDPGPVWAQIPPPRPSRLSRLSPRWRRTIAAAAGLALLGLILLAVDIGHDATTPVRAGSNGPSVGTVDIDFDLFDVSRPAPQRPPDAIDKPPEQRSA